MSVEAMKAALSLPCPKLPSGGNSPAAAHILLLLANYANEDGWTWPKVEKLVAKTGLSDRGVRGALDLLESQGAIMRVGRRWSDTGMARSDMIGLVLMGDDFIVGAMPREAGTQHFVRPATVAACPAAVSAGRQAAVSAGEDTKAKDTKGSALSVAAEQPKRRAKSRGPLSHFVPDDFTVSEKTMAALVTDNYTERQVAEQLVLFRDHEFHHPRSDWDRAFRRWVRQSPKGGSNGHRDQRFERHQASLARSLTGADLAAQEWRREHGD